MDFFAQTKAFFDALETSELPTSAIALWHALAFHAHQRNGTPLKLAVSTLCAKTGLSRKGVYNARNALKNAGLLEWRDRKGNLSAIYELTPFACTQYTQPYTQGFTQDYTQSFTQPYTIYNSSSVKDNSNNIPCSEYTQVYTQPYTHGENTGGWLTDEEADSLAADINTVLNEAQAVGIPLTQRDMDRGNALVAEYSAEWVVEALRCTVGAPASARSWRYVEGILRKWRERGGIDDAISNHKDSKPADASRIPGATLEELMGVLPK